MTLKTYERTQAEFLEAFKYGKMYTVKRVFVPGNVVNYSRMYLLKDGRFKVMDSIKKRVMLGLPKGVEMKEGDYLFEDAEGYLSIMRKGPIHATV